ncbi:MAG: tRNA (adenosine(37)-N6)-dimethylallyltransferase MiaA [Planctomycetota bacterium]|nr:tRNA (adenosine(37)-N6)-dimethylallyltransferase MiaA [Planctomycetota bacterium]
MTDEETPILILVGPTASGKTALSVELATNAPGGGECISADSMQVYRGMDIGTATPLEAERGDIPHHLLDVADPHEVGFTVHDWLAAAEAAISGTRQRDRLPIVVGGTNLYVRALLEGVFQAEIVPPEIREALEPLTNETLHARLLKVDPPSAQRIHPNDRRRMIRALEVFEATGIPISRQQTQWGDSVIEPRADAVIACLDWEPSELNRRINRRVGVMMDEGFLDEVRALTQTGPLGQQAREAVGYKELVRHLEGEMSLSEAIEQIKIRSRRYAKQQRTWMRRFHAIPGVLRVSCTEARPPADALEAIIAHVEAWRPISNDGR